MELVSIGNIPYPERGSSLYTNVVDSSRDLSGISYEWLLKNAVLGSIPSRGAVNTFYFQQLLVMGPLQDHVIERVQLLASIYQSLIYPEDRLVSFPMSYISETVTDNKFIVSASLFRRDDASIVVGTYDYRGIAARYINDQNSPIHSLSKFLFKSDDDQMERFRTTYMVSLLEQLCILFILDVGNINMDTIQMRCNEGQCYPLIIDVTTVRKTDVLHKMDPRTRGKAFYFDVVRQTRVTQRWTDSAVEFYPIILERIKRYDFDRYLSMDMLKITKLRDICIETLEYFLPIPNLNIEIVGKIDDPENDLSLDKILDWEEMSKITLGMRRGANAGNVVQMGKIDQLLLTQKVYDPLALRDDDKGGMDAEGRRTYSYGDPDVPNSEAVFTIVTMGNALEYYMAKGMENKSLICATELHRVREMSPKADAAIILEKMILRTVLSTVCVVNPDLVTTVVSVIARSSRSREPISFIHLSNMILAICRSHKSEIYRDIWKIYMGYDRFELGDRGAGIPLDSTPGVPQDDYISEYEYLTRTEQFQSISIKVNSALRLIPDTDELKGYRMIACLFLNSLILKRYSCISWLRKYREYSYNTDNAFYSTALGNKNAKRVNAMNFIILLFKDYFGDVFSAFKEVHLKHEGRLSGRSNYVLMYMTFCVLEDTLPGREVILPSIMTEADADAFLSGNYPIPASSILEDTAAIYILTSTSKTNGVYYTELNAVNNEVRHSKFIGASEGESLDEIFRADLINLISKYGPRRD